MSSSTNQGRSERLKPSRPGQSFPPPPLLPGALSHLSSASAGSRTKRTRFDGSGGESTDLEASGTGFAAQSCQD